MILGRLSAKSRPSWHSRNKSANRPMSSLHRKCSSPGCALPTFQPHAHPRIPHPRPARRRRRRRRHRRPGATLVRDRAAAGRGGLGHRIVDGPVQSLTAGIERWISQTEGTTGWDALGVWGTVIAVLAAVTAVAALGCLVPAMQGDRARCAAVRRARVLRDRGLEARGHAGARTTTLELRFGAFVAACGGADRVHLGLGRRVDPAAAARHRALLLRRSAPAAALRDRRLGAAARLVARRPAGDHRPGEGVCHVR